MKKFIGKKQIILAALVLALGTAIYINWTFANGDGALNMTGLLDTSSKNLGDATYVNNDGDSVEQKVAEDTQFTTARLNRKKTRDESLDVLKSIASGEAVEASARQEALSDIAKVALNIEREGRIENQVMAKGFEDCMVYIKPDDVSVLVKTSTLTQSQAIQIQEIVATETKIDPENISIVEVK